MNATIGMNNKEKRAIEELRKRMEGKMEEDMYDDIYVFYRFLKARDFNVANAEEMLRKHLEWCKNIDLKNISLTEVVEKYFPYNFIGFDKEGDVVRYVVIGDSDIAGFLNSITPEEAEQSLTYYMEEDIARLKEQSRKFKRNIDKCTGIYNLQNLSLRILFYPKVIEFILAVARCFEKNYPERLKNLHLINGSAFMTILCNMLKAVIGTQTLRKMHFYSDDSWKEAILNDIDADVLPAFLGGNRTDPDGNPRCLTFINHGRKVPEHYYLHRTKRLSSDTQGVKKMILSFRSSHEEPFEVNDPGASLEWEFETKSGDIAFGLFYEEMSDSVESRIEIIPLQKTGANNSKKAGSYLCEKLGNYVFVFDNSFSWIRSKEICYRINIRRPEEDVH